MCSERFSLESNIACRIFPEGVGHEGQEGQEGLGGQGGQEGVGRLE